jgi:SAM-dependent methyltransferase
MTTATLPASDALSVYDRALLRAAGGRSAPLLLHDHRGGRIRVDPARWCRPHLPGDAGLLARCAGPTLDVGCGPGRLTAALSRLGRPALGIDVSAAAVRLARRRGATALRRDVFATLPGHGRWPHLLLADGNIGIGGDPRPLLARSRTLLARGGRLHVELAAPGTRSWSGPAALTPADVEPTFGEFRWAVVGMQDLSALAEAAAMRTLDTWTEAGRWFATLTAA